MAGKFGDYESGESSTVSVTVALGVVCIYIFSSSLFSAPLITVLNENMLLCIHPCRCLPLCTWQAQTQGAFRLKGL